MKPLAAPALLRWPLTKSTGFLNSIAHDLGELIAPGQCLECSGPAENGWCCHSCQAKLNFADATWCPSCALPHGHNHSAGCRFASSPRKSGIKLPWEQACTLGAYSGVIRQACLLGKKSSGQWATEHLVRQWWIANQHWAESVGSCLIVPVPRHWTRRWLVGHDPAIAIADLLTKRWKPLGGKLARILYRKRSTPQLSGLVSEERDKVMKDLFGIKNHAKQLFLKSTPVILVDDIYTTGATAKAASTALLNAGASKIYFASLGRTLESDG